MSNTSEVRVTVHSGTFESIRDIKLWSVFVEQRMPGCVFTIKFCKENAEVAIVSFANAKDATLFRLLALQHINQSMISWN